MPPVPKVANDLAKIWNLTLKLRTGCKYVGVYIVLVFVLIECKIMIGILLDKLLDKVDAAARNRRAWYRAVFTTPIIVAVNSECLDSTFEAANIGKS